MDPAQVQIASLRTNYLISAIGNAVAFLVGSISVFVGGAATCGIGCLFFFLPLINLIVMIFDFLAHGKTKEPPTPAAYSFFKMTAIFELFACFALIPLIMGVLNLQLLGKPELHAYFHPSTSGLDGTSE